jgi:hypothetical protein
MVFKRKRNVPASASGALLREQASVTYVPAKRLRNQGLSALASAKLNAALSNDISRGWERTSNVRTQQKGEHYNVVVCLRTKKEAAKGCRKFSERHASIHAAEEAAFDFRHSIESSSAKQKITHWLDSTTSLFESRSGTTDAAPPVVKLELVLQTITNKCASTARKKHLSMTSSLHLRSVHNPPNMNPCNPKDSATYEERGSVCANKIQKVVRRRDRKRAEKALTRTLEEQGCRMTLMSALATMLSKSDWNSLLLGGDDQEIAATHSKFDQDHALEKARHVHEALRTMCSAHLEKRAVTWRECCESAALANFNKHTGRTVMVWCAELHKAKNQLKFRRSLRGRESNAAKSPFLEDKSLTLKFKAWARDDLEHLTVSKVTDWVNMELLHDWTASQLHASKTRHPTSQNIAACWMRESGFCCCGHKKSCYVDRHEDTDVVESRNACVVNCFEEESYEHCWVQLTKKVCLKMKMRKKQEKLAERKKVKQEFKNASKIEQCIDAYIAIERHLDSKACHCTDPDTGAEMVEAHADTVHSYNEDAASKLPAGVPPLPDMGGHLSVRMPIGARPRVPFGQDEAMCRSAQLNDLCRAIDGQQTMRSKTDGVGRMVSACGTREFGFGFYEITVEQMKRTNEARSGKKHADEDAATCLLGSPEKQDLLVSPFVRMLAHGAAQDGHWSHNHMVLQIDDCFDCFKMLHPEFDMVWELDHSSGHSAELPAGLTTKQTGTLDGGLGWNHGGKKRHVRDSMLTAKDVGAVLHDRFKGTGATQKMDFIAVDSPPTLDPDCPKHATPTGKTKTRDATVSELKIVSLEKGLSADGKKAALTARCVGAN